MIRRLNNVRDRLKRHLEFVPVLLMGINVIVYIKFLDIVWGILIENKPVEAINFPEWYLYIESVLKHFTEASFALIMVLYLLSKEWRFLSKLSLGCLFALWLNNLYYIITETYADVYFYVSSSVIYATFVILTIRRLTK